MLADERGSNLNRSDNQEGSVMLNNDRYIRIQNSSEFKELVIKRRNFAWILSAIILIAYYVFILTIAFYPTLLGTPISEGKVTTVGIPVGLFIIFLSFILTGIYVRRANGEFDELTKTVVEKSLK